MEVAALVRSTAGGTEPRCGAPGQCPAPGVDGAQRGAIRVRPLQVVADDLLVTAVLLDPVSMTLVELGALELGDGVVGDLEQEEMPEAKRVVLYRPEQLSPHEALQGGAHRRQLVLRKDLDERIPAELPPHHRAP